MDVQEIGLVDHIHLLEELKSLTSELGISKYKQISLQAPIENANPKEWWESGNGRVSAMEYSEESYKYPLFNFPLINHYIRKFNMFRTRVMRMEHKSCLSYHYDFQKRIHFPLITNEKCMMIISDKAYWLIPGKAYLTDTTKMHTAINGNKDPFTRIHIVGCVNN